MSYRSTKGASKQRRDAINDRISEIRELIPLTESTRGRLSQLQVMAFTNSYVAKSNFFAEYSSDIDDRSSAASELFDFTQSLPGFLLMAGVDGRILYISENVSEYLGNSAVDVMTQMDSIYDVIDERDRHVLRQAMTWQMERMSWASDDGVTWLRDVTNGRFDQADSTADELSFVCRLNTVTKCVRNGAAQLISKTSVDNEKTIQINGRFIRPRSSFFGARLSQHSPRLSTVFVAHCTPQLAVSCSYPTQALMPSVSVADKQSEMMDTLAFRSLHGLDMKFVTVEENGEFHLDFDRGNVFGKSWYEMIHPEDMEDAQLKHMEIVNSYQIGDVTLSRSLCVRVQTGTGRSLWLHVVMRIHCVDAETDPDSFARRASRGGNAMIVCANRVIDETAALFLRIQEVEMTATKDIEKSHVVSVSHLGTDKQFFDGVQFPRYETASAKTHSVSKNCYQRDEPERQRIQRRLKRKIIERVNDAKCTKLMKLNEVDMQADDVASHDGSSLMYSMPSPPMNSRDYHAAASEFPGLQSCHSSTMSGSGWFPGSSNLGTMAAGINVQINGNPESYLTPSHSPASSLDQSSSAVAEDELFDLSDFIRRLPEDDSFFGSTSSPHQRTEEPLNSANTIEVGICAARDFPILPELDHQSIASILGDFELPALSPEVYPIVPADFDRFEGKSHRQQFSDDVMGSGGNGRNNQQLVEFGVVVPDACRPRHVVPTSTAAFAVAAGTGTGTEKLRNMGMGYECYKNGVIVDQMIEEPLISNLFSLAGEFLQNLAFDEANHCSYEHHQFEAPMNHFELRQFQGAVTSCFD